jgi:glycosyltransferase involved in cell wall biosynthesis
VEALAAISLVAGISAMIDALPRVLFVGAFPPPNSPIFGGMVTSCRALLASTFSERVQLELLDSTQFSNPPPPLALRVVLAARRLVRFICAFEARRPEVVLLFVAVGASIVEKGVMARYARMRGVPTFMFPRGGSIIDACRSSGFTRVWARVAFRGATKIVCQGQAWRRFAIDVLGFASTDVVVIRNWTATRELLDVGARRERRQGFPIRLVFVGWLEREKGIFELIEACRQLHPDRQFTLDIVGDGHASEEARVLVTRYGLTEVVRFRGWLQVPELTRTLIDGDVLVLPSWAEGLPNAVVEAMAARLAVVVTGVGAIPDVITDHRSGLLVTPQDSNSLRVAMAEVIDDSDLRERLAAEAYKIAVRDFGVEGAADKLLVEIKNTIAAARTTDAFDRGR